MRLPLPTISSKYFTYDSAKREFFAEASTLRGFKFLSRIYDDACDAGFAMESERTGVIATFVLVREDENPDDAGDVAWNFEAIGPFGGVLMGLKGVRVVIVND